MSEGRNDILILAGTRRNAPEGSAAWCMALALAEQQRVFFIEPPCSYFKTGPVPANGEISLPKNAGAQSGSMLPASPDQAKNLHILIPPPMLPLLRLPRGKLFYTALQNNRKRFAQWLQAEMDRRGIQPALWLNASNPHYDPPIPGVPRVYYCLEEATKVPIMRKHGSNQEQKIMRQADLVLAATQKLLTYAQLSGAQTTRLLRKGIDYWMFAKATYLPIPKPAAMEQAGGPVNLVFLGPVEETIDLALVQQIIRQRPRWQWWWLGSGQKKTIAALQNFPQCHFTGPLPQRELASWLQHADCGIIPFQCLRGNRDLYPLKLHEYLAAGKGVVSTPFSSHINTIPPHILLAETVDEWILAVEKLHQQSHGEQAGLRSAYARQHSWDDRADTLLQLLREQRLFSEEAFPLIVPES